MQLTVLCPGIRTQNWRKLYDSCAKSFHGSWEIIFIGPEPPEGNLIETNVRYIKDMGTPIRAQQRGLCEAQGEYVTWAADDGVFLPYALDVAFGKLTYEHFHNHYDYKTLVMGKYTEGDGDTKAMLGNEYYVLSNHDASRSKWLPAGWFMLNVGVVPRTLLEHIGGWDCQFEVCPMAYNDLAYRLQNFGCKFIIQDELMFKCSHLPQRMGDHGPIHDAQIDCDQPLFRKIWGVKECQERTIIDLDNWKNCPERWVRRFGWAAGDDGCPG